MPATPTVAPSTIDLLGMSRQELADLFVSWGEKPFRSKQLWRWLYVRLAGEVAAMTDLSKGFRERLAASIVPLRPEIRSHAISRDGTQKWLLAFGDGERVEAVHIPEVNRGTLCISSQAGCSLSCPFCRTGTYGLSRNLTASEIVSQVVFARSELGPQERRVTNVVLMGMGEPLYNYDAVVKGVGILMDPNGLAIGSRKITLSTAGVAPRLVRVGHDLGVNLAISLHSVRDSVRDRLVPLNQKYNLAELKQAAWNYPLKGGRRITWEYLLLDGVNDGVEDARELADYLEGIPSKINLIAFNPWPGSSFSPSPPEAVERFQQVLWDRKLVTVMRESRGGDIAAACGQLLPEKEAS
ncbi:MAG: 23S rRNA (adenine(2503)-C(2))-methyltransferase RlmN [Magnetococcales bacterium]|nr:23S rRNA (adenine(2503)-C(2))-methyltransferase RlmN [Magnetococcales bacterium]